MSTRKKTGVPSKELVPVKSTPPAELAKRPAWAEGLDYDDFRFCMEYLVDMNARQAMLRFKPHLLPTSAGVEGSRRLNSETVRRALDAYLTGDAGRSSMRARLADLYASIAFQDPNDYFDVGPEGVKIKDISQLSLEQRRAVKKVKQVKGKNPSIEMELHSPLEAARELGRAVGFDKSKEDKPTVAIQINFVPEDLCVI